MKNIDWAEIQKWYDSGNYSLRDTYLHFRIPKCRIYEAVKAGKIIKKSSAIMRAIFIKKKIINGTLKFTDTQRETLRQAMRAAVLRSPASYSSNSVCGRAKMYEYNGAKFKGSWELLIAKTLDAENIKWKREVTPIPYFYEGREHLYFPDFWLPEFEAYIEVKGYATQKDFAKWESAKRISKMIIIRKKEYQEIECKKASLIEIINEALLVAGP